MTSNESKRCQIYTLLRCFYLNYILNFYRLKRGWKKTGFFTPWRVNCLLCKKPETVEHVFFLDCWDAIFFWDVLQWTLKKEFPLSSHGIRNLAVENADNVPNDLVMHVAYTAFGNLAWLYVMPILMLDKYENILLNLCDRSGNVEGCVWCSIVIEKQDFSWSAFNYVTLATDRLTCSVFIILFFNVYVKDWL